jgi:hypothetical protein
MSEKKEYKCEVCIKQYKNYKSLWKHNYVYHKPVPIKSGNNVVINSSIGVVKSGKNIAEPKINLSTENISKNRICKICNKILCDRFYKIKHEKKCKKEQDLDLVKIKQENNDLKNQITELSNTQKTILKKIKLSPKSAKSLKIINNNNNINNNTINNNTVNIMSLGRENVIPLMTEQDKLKILKSYQTVEDPHIALVRAIYNDPKFIDARNTIITNLQTKTCLAYNENTCKFDAVNKDEHLDNLIYYRQCNIKDLYNKEPDLRLKMDNLSKKLIECYIENCGSLKSSKLYNKHKEEIIYIIYNCKDMMMDLKNSIEI